MPHQPAHLQCSDARPPISLIHKRQQSRNSLSCAVHAPLPDCAETIARTPTSRVSDDRRRRARSLKQTGNSEPFKRASSYEKTAGRFVRLFAFSRTEMRSELLLQSWSYPQTTASCLVFQTTDRHRASNDTETIRRHRYTPYTACPLLCMLCYTSTMGAPCTA